MFVTVTSCRAHRCQYRQGTDKAVFVGDLVNKGLHHTEVRPLAARALAIALTPVTF